MGTNSNVVFLAMEPEMNCKNAHMRSSRPARRFGVRHNSVARLSMKEVKLMYCGRKKIKDYYFLN